MRITLAGTTLLLLLAVFCAGDKVVSNAQSKPEIPKQTAPELILQTGHAKLVEAVVFAPDSRWVASGSFDNSIKIWETETGRELRSLSGHTGAVKGLAVSPDGQWLASGGNDRSLRVWDVKNGKETGNFPNPEGTIETVAFTTDGKLIASGGSEGTIIIRDAATGKETARLPGTSAITSVAFSPDGKLLTSASSDYSISVWDLIKLKPAATLKGHTRTIDALRFSPNSDLLASGGADGIVKLWKTANWRSIGDLTGHSGVVLAFHFASQDKLLSADSNRSVKIWATAANKMSASSAAGMAADQFVGDCKSAVFSPDGSILATGNGDGTISLIDSQTGSRLRTLENHTTGFYGVAFSSDRRWLASASFDNTVKLWDLQTGESLRPLAGHTGRVRNVAVHPDNTRIISGSADHTIRLWDAVTQRPLDVLQGHKNSVSSLAVGGKGKYIVSGSMDQTVGIWDVESRIAPRFLTGHNGEVISVAISNSEDKIVSAGMDGTIRLWDVASGTMIRTIDPKAGEIDSVAISPDGKLIVSGGIDKTIRLWESETGRMVRTISGHAGKIHSVAFSPDGAAIVSSGQDKTIRVWRVLDGGSIREMAGHTGTVFTASYSTDGSLLASASDDGSLIVWKNETGGRMATLISLKKSDDWMVVSPEGFFDGSPPSWEQLSWRFENDTFNVKPVEVFFNEFFLPGLLADLVNNRDVPTKSDISTKDRRQPVVTLAADGGSRTEKSRTLKVNIDISQAPSGAKDLRLFRNGALVKAWRGDVMKGQNSVSLSTVIPIVAGANRLTAYAFNTADVKSKNAVLTFTGSAELARKGVSYILAVGVNAYANPDYNLNVAVADAKDFADELKLQQMKLSQYEKVETILLADADATKANILRSLSELTGRIQPEDWVTIFFAGHGVAKDKRFYLVPHDLGFMGSRSRSSPADLQTILDHSISDEEIDRVVEGIDAKQLLLVIDACNSGQVLETDEKRSGPMNSKGLAQLAYEKGMYILTASQSYQNAKEDDRLGHGYLTYALVSEGLRTGVADKLPKDGQVLLREWLDFATARVPQIDQEEQNTGKKRARRLEREKTKSAGGYDDLSIQRPRVFYRRESEAQPIVVSRY